MERENILVLDFGGQYNQLIARRVRECHVYCEVHSSDMEISKIREMSPKGIILTGGPNSCSRDMLRGADPCLAAGWKGCDSPCLRIRQDRNNSRYYKGFIQKLVRDICCLDESHRLY